MKNLYIDFDGVILDTINTMYRIMDDLGLDRDLNKDNTEFYANLDWHNIIEITPEINNSIECIKNIVDSKKFDVAILTHIHSVEEIVAKAKFIHKHLGIITIISVPKKISKTKMVSATDSILIDDYSGNLREWEDAGGIGIRFSTDLESKGFKVINHLDQIIDMEL